MLTTIMYSNCKHIMHIDGIHVLYRCIGARAVHGTLYVGIWILSLISVCCRARFVIMPECHAIVLAYSNSVSGVKAPTHVQLYSPYYYSTVATCMTLYDLPVVY